MSKLHRTAASSGGAGTLSPSLNFFALTSIQAGIYICISAIMAGHILYTMTGFKGALISLIIGSVILWGLGLLFARLSLVHRKVLIEIVAHYFGKTGAQICGLGFGISLLGWFALQLELMAKGIHLLCPLLPLWLLKVTLGCLITVNVVKGMGWIARFADVSVPFLIIMMAYILWLTYDPSVPFPETEWNYKDILVVLSFSLAGIIDAPTYFCESRSAKDAYIATTIVYLFILPFLALVGFSLAFYTGIDDFVMAIMGLRRGAWPFLVILFIILSGWTTNNGNLYSASVALRPSIRLNWVPQTWCLGILGTGVACLGILERFCDALEAMAIILSSLGAALLGCFLKDGLDYKILTQKDRKYYNLFIITGILIGVLSQFKWITLFNSSFIDSFASTLFCVFLYEVFRKCIVKSA